MKRFVWDTSALLNVKEPDSTGYSPGLSLYKDLSDGWIPGPYQNIFPAIIAFELDAAVSRKHREYQQILREFYVVNENAIVYPIDQDLVRRSSALVATDGFSSLRGADLAFACIAKLEDAYLVTRDRDFLALNGKIKVIDLNESRTSPNYRRLFGL